MFFRYSDATSIPFLSLFFHAWSIARCSSWYFLEYSSDASSAHFPGSKPVNSPHLVALSENGLVPSISAAGMSARPVSVPGICSIPFLSDVTVSPADPPFCATSISCRRLLSTYLLEASTAFARPTSGLGWTRFCSATRGDPLPFRYSDVAAIVLAGSPSAFGAMARLTATSCARDDTVDKPLFASN